MIFKKFEIELNSLLKFLRKFQWWRLDERQQSSDDRLYESVYPQMNQFIYGHDSFFSTDSIENRIDIGGEWNFIFIISKAIPKISHQPERNIDSMSI